MIARVACVVAALVVAGVARAQTTDVALGIEALARRDVRAADAAFARATTSTNPLIRPTAWQWRAHVAWRLRDDTGAARRHLGQAMVLSRGSSPIMLEAARFDAATRRYREAQSSARIAMETSLDGERRGLAVRTLVALAVEAAFSTRAPIADSVDLRGLSIARDTLAARVARFPGRTADALALINAAAMLGDSASVSAGVRSYYALHDDRLQPAIDSILNSRSLAGALIAGRLFEQAALLMRSRPGEGDAATADAVAYAEFLRNVRHATEGVYRASLARTARPGDVSRVVTEHGRRLWRVLHWDGAAPEFYPNALYRELARRFGTVISIERSRGMDELYLAHRIGSYEVTADRRPGTVQVLDGSVADGIDHWILDGTGGRAGWVSADTIFARRTGFTETPFRAWVSLTDPQTMPGELLRIMRDSVGDIERVKRDSVGYLPGVAARMFRQGAEAILDSLYKVDGMSNADRAAAFASALFHALTTSSIVLHESRHLADARAGRLGNDATDEFRAKLDEVIGAPRPRLALTAILVPNIGDLSSHGQANRRVMLGLSRWMRRNGSKIAAYDKAVPALLQLPNLSDAQLVDAFRSMRVP